MLETEPIPQGKKITRVALYCEQPILAAGLQAVVAGYDDCTVSEVFTDLERLGEDVQTSRPSVILLELTANLDLATLSKVTFKAGSVPVVLWVNAPSAELVASVLAIGIRGILRRNLSLELQIRCLRCVAAGDLWVEQAIASQLLTTKPLSVTRRERQLVSLLIQGLKNKEIAHAMGLSEGTIKVYLSHLFHKLGVRDRFELSLFALENGRMGIV